MLSTEQRKRKRIVQRRATESKRLAAKQKTGADNSKAAHSAQDREYCVHIKPNNKQCGGFQAYGTQHCRHHMTEDERITAGLDPTPLSGPDGKLAASHVTHLEPMQMYRRVVEKSMVTILEQYLRALGLELYGFDPTGDPQLREIPNGGLKLHGESKDGDIIMTNFDDLLSRIEVAEKMINRVYGKPKQSTVIEGGRIPLKVQPVRDVQHATEVAGILAAVGALPRAPADLDGVIEAQAKPHAVPDE